MCRVTPSLVGVQPQMATTFGVHDIGAHISVRKQIQEAFDESTQALADEAAENIV